MKIIRESEKRTRDFIQNKAVELSTLSDSLVLNYPTGLGKSYTMIKILDSLISKNKNFKTIILEPETALITNIKEEFKKFKKEHLLKNIDIICYASLKKLSFQYDIIILDEAHHSFSDLRLQHLENQNPKFLLLLSATIETSQIKKIEKLFNKDILIHQIDLKQAIDWDILPKPKIGIFPLQLNVVKNTFYIIERGNKSKQIEIEIPSVKMKWKYLRNKKEYPNLKLKIKCSELEKYNYLCDDAIYYKGLYNEKRDLYYTKEPTNKNLEELEKLQKYWLYSELKIKRFLSEIKTPYLDIFLKDIIEENNRFVVFFGSVNQAKELAKKHGTNLIASENKASLELIQQFNDKKINSLYCCKMLNEGQNLTGLDIGVLTQLDSKNGAFVQKVGRSLRSDMPQIYIFYYKNTKDEKYLKNALRLIDKNYITYLDYFLT